MVENVQIAEKIHESSDLYNVLNDKMNDLYGFMFAITNFLCPIVGAAMESSLGIRQTYDVMWIIDFSFCLILIIFNCGIHPLKDANNLKIRLKKY